MDTKVASHVAKQMAQFFKVFKEVEEVLEAAAMAQNAAGELQDLIAKRSEELNRLVALRDAEIEKLAQAREAHEEAKKGQARESEALRENVRKELADMRAAAEAELAIVKDETKKVRQAHAEFVEQARSTEADLTRSINALQKQLGALKARVAGL